MFERATFETDAGLEYVVAKLTHHLSSGVSGDLLSRPVERGNPAALVNGEYAVGDTVQDQPCYRFVAALLTLLGRHITSDPYWMTKGLPAVGILKDM